jgi:transcription initiation factor TFIID TATA-box-binding protein
MVKIEFQSVGTTEFPVGKPQPSWCPVAEPIQVVKQEPENIDCCNVEQHHHHRHQKKRKAKPQCVPCLCTNWGCTARPIVGVPWRDHMRSCLFVPQPTVENLVMTTFIGQEVDLNKLFAAFRSRGMVRKSQKFPSGMWRLYQDIITLPVTVSVFGSGKVVCPGAKNIEGAVAAMYRVLDLVSETCGVFERPKICMRNVVGCLRLRRYLDLKLLKRNLPRSVHKPRKFPGLLAKNMETGVHFLIFKTGSIVITGARSIDQLNDSVWYIVTRLCPIMPDEGQQEHIDKIMDTRFNDDDPIFDITEPDIEYSEEAEKAISEDEDLHDFAQFIEHQLGEERPKNDQCCTFDAQSIMLEE